jgi:DNA-binding MarR family transcriptional regulator
MQMATSATARSTPHSDRFRAYDRHVPLAPAAAEALLDEIGELLAIMLRISRRLENADEPMTATQRLALMEVSIVGPMRLSNLAARMDTTPATASRAIDVLERYELVVRRPDPDDGRATLIAATTKGKRWTDERRSLVLSILGQLDIDRVPAPSLTPDLAALNAALRGATGHDAVARGALLAP